MVNDGKCVCVFHDVSYLSAFALSTSTSKGLGVFVCCACHIAARNTCGVASIHDRVWITKLSQTE